MAKSAGRLGDLTTGHDCHPPQIAITSSQNVIINKRGALRIGDDVTTHCCEHDCHPGNMKAGSGTVKINKKAACRIQDAVSCGGSLGTGSQNVMIGD